MVDHLLLAAREMWRRPVRIALLLVLSLGCRAEAPAPVASDAAVVPLAPVRVKVVDETPPHLRPAPASAEALSAELRAAFGEQSADQLPEGWRLFVQARVVYGLTQPTGLAAKAAAGPVKAQWRISLKLRPPGGEALYVQTQGVARRRYAGPPAPLGETLSAVRMAAARAAVEMGMERVGWVTGDEAALIEALGHPDRGVRRLVAERLAMLRAKGAVPALVARLSVELDGALRLRLVGVLAEIGDERAASALMAMVDTKDRELLGAIVEALSVMGGARVDDFLGILAVHDSAEVRTMVEAARARLKRNGAVQDEPKAGDER